MSRKSESGQAIVLLVFALIGLMGFTALAIDGGMVYSDRRHAQSSSDAASLAGGGFAAKRLEYDNIFYENFNCNTLPSYYFSSAGTIGWATQRAKSNGYEDSQISVTVNCVDDGSGEDEKYLDVNTVIDKVTDTALIHFVYDGPAVNVVESTVRVRPRHPVRPFSFGFAIVSMHDCIADGDHNYAFAGGGNSGGVETWNGGMFINSPDNGGQCCSIDSPNASGAIGVIAHDGYQITSVGSCNHAGDPKVDPNPIQTGFNGGAPMDDPLPTLAMPTCGGAAPTNVTVDGQTYDFGPGNMNGISPGTYAPGVYCISGDTHLSGQSTVTAIGVTFYFIDGGLNYTGNAGMTLTAPQADTCTGDACNYVGIAILAARDNTSVIEVRGNGGNAIEGLVYALTGSVQARGGGSDPDETVVIGQVITGRVLGNGNGSFKVTYADTYDDGGYQKPTTIDLTK